MRQYELKEIIRILNRFKSKATLGKLISLGQLVKDLNKFEGNKYSVMTFLQELERVFL